MPRVPSQYPKPLGRVVPISGAQHHQTCERPAAAARTSTHAPSASLADSVSTATRIDCTGNAWSRALGAARTTAHLRYDYGRNGSAATVEQREPEQQSPACAPLRLDIQMQGGLACNSADHLRIHMKTRPTTIEAPTSDPTSTQTVLNPSGSSMTTVRSRRMHVPMPAAADRHPPSSFSWTWYEPPCDLPTTCGVSEPLAATQLNVLTSTK